MTARILLPKAKSDPRCGCVTGHYECLFCRGIKRQRIWNRMTERERAYDRYVDPINSAALDREVSINLDAYERGCSCHINSPCSYCTDQSDGPDDLATGGEK